ncbi:MAG: hypothetical protein AAF289_03965 [Cyanobacteria bacterium P01_A01_bin.135]
MPNRDRPTFSDDSFQSSFQSGPQNSNDYVIDIPAQHPLVYPEKVPSGYDPMGDIALRGRVCRRIASGEVPWWLLTGGWFLVGCGAAVVLSLVISSGDVAVLLLLLTPAYITVILWRGTHRRLKRRRR